MMSNEDAVKALIAHRIRFRDDFGWDKTTLEALDIAITSLTTKSKSAAKGKWLCEGTKCRIGYNDYEYWNKWRCSCCGYIRTEGWEHTSEGQEPKDILICENCGADMQTSASK